MSFSDLHGWEQDDLEAALAVFRRSCQAPETTADLDRGPIPAQADRSVPGDEFSRAANHACEDAASVDASAAAARRFFEHAFDPVEVTVSGRDGFLTGYYEPEFDAGLSPTARFTTPLLTAPVGDAGRADRAAIEDGALATVTRPLAFLDPVDAFTVHVQGSARLRLPDGSALRVAYAGRNGQPYTAVARILAERLGVPPARMDANRMVAWLKANPVEAPALMRANRSYIFFRTAESLRDQDGPIGAANVPLTAGRSLAIDHRAWRYGSPVWLEGSLPGVDGDTLPLARLTVAQDTGAAIRGAARADLFLGTGPEAGRAAGLVRERVRLVVFRPKPARGGTAR